MFSLTFSNDPKVCEAFDKNILIMKITSNENTQNKRTKLQTSKQKILKPSYRFFLFCFKFYKNMQMHQLLVFSYDFQVIKKE